MRHKIWPYGYGYDALNPKLFALLLIVCIYMYFSYQENKNIDSSFLAIVSCLNFNHPKTEGVELTQIKLQLSI